MKKRDIINIIVIFVLIAVGTFRLLNRKYTFNDTQFLMDTVVTIKIETREKNGEDIIKAAYKLMEKYENKLSFYKEGSTLRDFNESESNNLELDEDFRQIFELADLVYSEADSLYDVSVGRLTELWDYDAKIVPEQESIDVALRFIGFDKLIFSNDELIRPSGFKINLGSLAKGYIIDRTVEFLIENNVSAGYVNAGGDIRIFGQKKPLPIGIQHPRDEHNQIIDALKVQNKAIVTSGDYERFFIIDGVRYHHILDPRTGYPSRKAVSVTVISDSAFLADAYSTALFLLEPQKALELVESKNDLEAVILTEENGEIKKFESSGIKNYRNEK
ncbi:MAG: FAD:protein FMN transferase [Candidatus Cloacimonadales bacterium]|nr:FAD:protein FMN transferase [Candidatus Cloacimonadales bacterium]